MRWAGCLFAACALFGLSGCYSKVTGLLELDGQPFRTLECRSGMAFNFSGIQLTDDAGRRLRLSQQLDGSVGVAAFSPGFARGEMIGNDCGTIWLQTQNSRINNIRNIEGNATLACQSRNHVISGTIEFENCH